MVLCLQNWCVETIPNVMVLLAYSGAISQESSILMDELKSKRDWGKWASPSIKWEHQEGTIFEAGCLTRHRISWHCDFGLPRTMSDIFLVFVSSLWLWSSVISAQMGQDSAKKAQWTWILTEGTVLWGWYLMGRKMKSAQTSLAASAAQERHSREESEFECH